jgi:hypothetical protein
MATKKERVEKIIIDFLKVNPVGKTYSEIVQEVQQKASDITYNTIVGSMKRFRDKYAGSSLDIPSRGFWMWNDGTNTVINSTNSVAPTNSSANSISEQDFYKSFAEWLVGEDFCSESHQCGGGSSRAGKWATPDVIGVLKAKNSDFYKFGTEVVVAEIKIDDSQNSLITAFGQACAYKLFSHKVFIVIPKTTSYERLQALCSIHGIGLVLFNSTDVANPSYELKLPPQKNEPDYFYLNKFANDLEVERSQGRKVKVGDMF